MARKADVPRETGRDHSKGGLDLDGTGKGGDIQTGLPFFDTCCSSWRLTDVSISRISATARTGTTCA